MGQWGQVWMLRWQGRSACIGQQILGGGITPQAMEASAKAKAIESNSTKYHSNEGSTYNEWRKHGEGAKQQPKTEGLVAVGRDAEDSVTSLMETLRKRKFTF